MLRSSFLFIAPLLAIGLIGCGKGPTEVKLDDKKDPPKNVAAPPPPVPVSPAGVPAPAAPGAVAVAKPKVPTSKPLPDLEPGFERFEVAKDEPPPYEVVPQSEIKPADLFTSVAPPAGSDSSTFVLAAAGKGAGAGAGQTATPAQTPKAVKLPDGFTAIKESGLSPDGHPNRIRCDKDQSEMAYVPAGVVRLGLENGPSEASPQLGVPLDAFYIDVAEVTVGQYEAYRTDVSESKKQFKQEPTNAKEPADYPVRGVLWSDARLFAQWAGKALPTESQWEMAARGPEAWLHPWGNDRAIWPKTRDMAKVGPVKEYRTDQSIYGVYDLAGNVREWVTDAFSPTAFKDAQNAATSTLKNWEGPKKSALENMRVVKGNGPGWVVWQRTGVSVREKPADVGFRCVLQLKPE